MVATYGQGYPDTVVGAPPQHLAVEIALDGVNYTDFGLSVPRQTFRCNRDNRTGMVTSSFDIMIKGGGGYTLSDQMPVRIYSKERDPLSAGTAPWVRVFKGILMGFASGVWGYEKVWKVRCVGDAHRLQHPPKPVTTQWPPGDGTPVINTTSLDGILSGVRTFRVADPVNLYPNKKVWVQNASGVLGRERITVSAVDGVNVTATFLQAHTIGFLLGSGVSNTELLRDGFKMVDPTGTTVSAAVAGTGAPITVTPASMTNIAAGGYVYCINADGTNPEMLLVASVGGGGTNFVVTNTSTKAAGWRVKPLLTYEGFLNEYYNYNSSTTSSTPITSASTFTFNVASTKNLFINRTVRVENADGSNREDVILTNVNVGASQATAAFGSTKSAGWRLYNGDPLDLVGIDEVQTSLPHMKWENTTPWNVLKELAAEGIVVTSVNTTSSSSVTAGYRNFTVASATGISLNQRLRVCNFDLSNSEIVEVSEISGTTITAQFQYVHNTSFGGPWFVIGATAPDFVVAWPPDNSAHTAPWQPRLNYYDVFDTNKRCTVDLSDDTSIGNTSAHYGGTYKRDIEGVRRITHQVVRGALNSIGEASDATLESAPPPDGVGRRISGEVVVDTTLQNNAECAARALTILNGRKRYRENVNGLRVRGLLSDYLFSEAKIVKWKHVLEGGTPAYYYVPNITLDYQDGAAGYNYELGTAMEQLGDAAIPIFGSASLRDTTPPDVPGWGPGETWLLSETYSQVTDRVAQHVQWLSSLELDLAEFWLEWNWGDGWIRQIVRNSDPNGLPPTDAYIGGLPPSTSVSYRVLARDRNGNGHQFSSVVTRTTTGRTKPTSPALGTVTQRYNPETRQTDITIPVTPSGSPNLVATYFYVTRGNELWRYTRAANTVSEEFWMTPGGTFSIYATAVNAWQQESAPSNTRSGTADLPPVPVTDPNGGFEGYVGEQDDLALNWERTEGGAGVSTARRDATPNFAHGGVACLNLRKYSVLASNPSAFGYFQEVIPGKKYVVRLWRRANVAGVTGQVEVVWYDNSSTPAPVHTDTLSLVEAPTSVWLPSSPSFTAPLVASSLRVRLINDYSVSASQLYFDDVKVELQAEGIDVARYLPDRLYNPNLKIPGISDALPDGYTITRTGVAPLPALDVTDVFSGSNSLKFTMPADSGASTLTILSDPMSCISPEAFYGAGLPQAIAQLIYRASVVGGTGGSVLAQLVFTDKADANPTTVDVIATSAPTKNATTGNLPTKKTKTVPAARTIKRLKIVITSGSVANTWQLGAFDCFDHLLVPTLAPGTPPPLPNLPASLPTNIQNGDFLIPDDDDETQPKDWTKTKSPTNGVTDVYISSDLAMRGLTLLKFGFDTVVGESVTERSSYSYLTNTALDGAAGRFAVFVHFLLHNDNTNGTFQAVVRYWGNDGFAVGSPVIVWEENDVKGDDTMIAWIADTDYTVDRTLSAPAGAIAATIEFTATTNGTVNIVRLTGVKLYEGQVPMRWVPLTWNDEIAVFNHEVVMVEEAIT